MLENLLTPVGVPFYVKTNEKATGRGLKYVVCECKCGSYTIAKLSDIGLDICSCGCLRSSGKSRNKESLEPYKDIIIDLYVNKKMTHGEISKQLKIGRTRIGKFLRDNNIPRNKNRIGQSNKGWLGCGEIPKRYVTTVKYGAKSRNIVFDITIEYLLQIWIEQNGKCRLTDQIINLSPHDKATASLDRINSDQGYIEGNVQWIHKDINLMKNYYNQDYFINMCSLISDKYKQDNLVMIPS